MAITIEAVYENGMLKLDEPLPLPERGRVRVTVEPLPCENPSGGLNLAEMFNAIEAKTGLIDGPRDWAARHDHYMFRADEGRYSDD